MKSIDRYIIITIAYKYIKIFCGNKNININHPYMIQVAMYVCITVLTSISKNYKRITRTNIYKGNNTNVCLVQNQIRIEGNTVHCLKWSII